MKQRAPLVLGCLLCAIAGCTGQSDFTVLVSFGPYGASAVDQNATIRIYQDRGENADFAPNPPTQVKGREGNVQLRARLILPKVGLEIIEIEVAHAFGKELVRVPLESADIHEKSLPGGITCFIAVSRGEGQP